MVKKPTSVTFRIVPEWTLSQTTTSLFISGGADSKFEIELDTDNDSFFVSPKARISFTREDVSNEEQRVLEELLLAEIVVPIFKQSKELKIAVVGDAANLELGARTSPSNADIIVITRATSTFAELLDIVNYQSIELPHLFIDMAYHHTVSIGPLVFPGETACVACLQGRVSTRWGDESPPKTPRVISMYRSVAAELIKTELERIGRGETGLTNKTVNWNFQDRVVTTNQLLKVPLCPICNKNKIDHRGALALPWGIDEGTSHTV